jgi:hypothetical protein
MTARVTTLLAMALALGLSAPAHAEEAEDRFSGIFQLDVTNAYYFRGILQEREGVILQPWTELYYSLYSDEDGFLRDVTIGAGMWSSFHSERTGASDTMGWWYEADYYPLVSMDFAGGLNLLTVYYFYTSPNDAFTTAQELNFKLSWDDSEFWDFALNPWANLAIETVNTAFGPDEGTGLQFGIAPTLYTAPNDAFELSMPAEAGVSIEDYYEGSDGENHFWGYANVGLAMSIPLTFMPEDLGSWSLGLAAKYFFFGHQLEGANRGRSSYPVGVASIGVEF